MRYTVRVNNGVYHVFDNHFYSAYATRDFRKDAESFAEYLNSRPKRGPRAVRPR